jgi:hypothetical protein
MAAPSLGYPLRLDGTLLAMQPTIKIRASPARVSEAPSPFRHGRVAASAARVCAHSWRCLVDADRWRGPERADAAVARRA